MIETAQSVTVRAPLDATWAHARDVERWAEIMPGYQSCELLDADRSHWVLKVGVGGLVRTVRVDVTVTAWEGPERVAFTFRLQGDPVEGEGTYEASARSPAETRVTLAVQVRGSGPMAPMWEAMGAPVLPRFARSFAEELAARIEAGIGAASEPETSGEAPLSVWQRLCHWFSRTWRRTPSCAPRQ